jgi:hypothetical protein
MTLLATKDTIRIKAYYLGSVWNARFPILPWHYTWFMTAVTVPVAILFLCFIGSWRPIKSIFTTKDKDSVLILLAVLIPLIVFSTPYATPHDGVRIFLNIFPFIAILSGMGADTVVEYIGRLIGKKIIVACAIAVIIPLSFLAAFASGMPYVVNYYNELVGGIRGADAAGLELDYWGQSYTGIVEWLNENAKTKTRIHAPIITNIFEMYKYGDIGLIARRGFEGRHNLSDTVSGIGWEVFEQDGLLRDDIELVYGGESDYYILLNRKSIIENRLPMKPTDYHNTTIYREYLEKCIPVYSVEADGVPLSMVYETDCINSP